MHNPKPLTVYLIAGEASGDLLGAHLMRELKAARPDVKIHGIGGPRMAAEGLKSLFPFDELSLMGFVEIIPHALKLSARINQAVDDIRLKRPDVLITIDSPGFCFRVVKKLRHEQFDTKYVHYVAPTVWAYKPERAQKCADLFDHLLVLLPFEPPYFSAVGLPCTFIGHPVVTETNTGDKTAFRSKYQIPASTKLFCLLPGSRKSEIKRHMPIFARAIAMLATRYPDLAIVVAVPPHMLHHVGPYFRNCPFRAVITTDEEDKKNAIAGADLAITKSGTVTLEIAMANTPMVVTHRMNPLSAWLFKRMASVRWVTLVNILGNKEIVPELLQETCVPALISAAAFQLITSHERITAQKTSYHTELTKLHPTENLPPSRLAVNCILQLLNR